MAHDSKRFHPFFLASFFSLPLFPSSTDEQRACFKKSVKQDLTLFFKLNQLLNRVQACILYLYFLFILPHGWIIWLKLQKRYLKEIIKLMHMLTRPPQIQFFKEEIKITATDTIKVTIYWVSLQLMNIRQFFNTNFGMILITLIATIYIRAWIIVDSLIIGHLKDLWFYS